VEKPDFWPKLTKEELKELAKEGVLEVNVDQWNKKSWKDIIEESGKIFFEGKEDAKIPGDG
jgi:hypothetical protein